MADSGYTPRVFKIKLPMRVKTSSKKKQALNLNVYRNLHHRSLHAQKKKFEEIAKKLLSGIPPLGVITLHYEVCPQTKRRLDIMNVGSIVDKYFSDALTEEGIILDDDFHNIPRVTFVFGELVPKEYVQVTITEIEPRSTPMRVLLDYDDIQAALTTYVSTLNIPNASGVKLSADELGDITAEVLFLTTEDPVVYVEKQVEDTPTPPIKRRKRRTKAEIEADNAKEAAANVDELAETGTDRSGEGDAAASGDEDSVPTAETETGLDTSKATPKGNLFGDKASPSSEDDATDKVADPTPPPVATPGKGSIFDT